MRPGCTEYFNRPYMDFEELTWREQEILALLAGRLTNREIADRLHLAESTVKDYVSHILEKLYVKNRRQAVERGLALGILGGERKEPARPAVNLPSFTSPFIGRTRELQAIEQHLEKARLVTISGLGGAGKTRLAVQAGKHQLGKFAHGGFLVSLAPVETPDQLIQAIAETVKFPLATSEEPVRQLIRYLRQKQLLLILDNFEHLLEGASILDEILRAAPDVKMLVTTRERLNLPGEVNIRLGGMTLPEDGDQGGISAVVDAVDLFIQNAGSTIPSFSPSAEDLKVIAEICKIVGGMPLAIELAAAWLNVLTLDEIRAEIERSFDFLSSEKRAIPERHRSLRNIFDHSWALLRPGDQLLFGQLSVFRGGFTRKAAENIFRIDLPALSRMVNQSVLRFEPSTGRYEIHEMIRQYAYERLQGRPDLFQSSLESHAAYFAAGMARKWDELRDGRQIQALKDIDADIENIRAAWRFHLDGADAPQIKKYINSFWLVYWIRGWNLGAVRLFGDAVERLKEHPEQEVSAAVRAHAMSNQAFFLTWLGQAEKAYAMAAESINISGTLEDPIVAYFSYHGLTLPAYYLGKVAEEKDANIRMLEIAETLDDNWLLAFGKFLLSITLLRGGDLPEAERLAMSGFDEGRALQDLFIQAVTLSSLGHVASRRGDYEAARVFYQEGVDAASLLGFRWAIGNMAKYLGRVMVALGQFAAAEAHFMQSLTIAYEHDLVRDIANVFYEMAEMRILQGRKEEGLEILGMLLEMPESRQEHLGRGRIRDSARKLMASLEEQLAPQTISKYLDRGRNSDPAVYSAALLDSHRASTENTP